MSLEVPAHSIHAGKPASRIRQKNEQAILQAAEDEFARHGYKGTSMNTIAASAGLPKANLHYYFTNKLGLYIAVLSNILELWDSTFNALTAEDDPAEALTRYIRAKMEFSRRQPQASRIFAMEIISGGECLTEYFSQDYRAWFSGRGGVPGVDRRRQDGPHRSRAPDLPAVGQHPALRDFATQICRVTGRSKLTKQDMDDAGTNLIHIILKGCGIKPAY
jgi:TetR/AcrR family transcriptional regulator